jgi:RNA polymerase sigma factor (sigma-70 family)
MATVQTYTDAELVAAIVSKTTVNQALTYLYRQYYRPLERYVLTNQGSEMDAEDLVQDVMVSFVDLVQRDKFRGEASVKSMLYTLARNHWISILRKRGSDTKRDELFETERDQTIGDVSGYVLDREAQQTLTSLFERLGDTCRSILQLFYY